METKKYSDSNDVMLIKAKIVARNAKEDTKYFVVYQPDYTIGYMEEIEKKADDAMVKFIGKDKTEQERQATELVTGLTKTAFGKTRMLKVLVENNFKKGKDEILTHLAYPKYYRSVGKFNQEAAVSLTSAITREAEWIKAKFAERKLPVQIIDEIAALSTELVEAETTQEQLKGSSKPLTQEQYEVLNKIYEQVIDICKLGKVVFADDEIKKSRYIYKRLGSLTKKSNGKKNNGGQKNNSTEEPV